MSFRERRSTSIYVCLLLIVQSYVKSYALTPTFTGLHYPCYVSFILVDFCEMMRGLGYPRVVSLESFATPNFELVADTLYWLLERYDPQLDVNDEIATEHDRISFLKQVAQFLMVRARLKINIKRLYGADGYAVKELLKIASLLYTAKESEQRAAMATGASKSDLLGPAGGESDPLDSDDLPSVSQRQADVKAVRLLASEITSIGATLYDSLGREGELKEARNRALHRNMDPEEISRSIQEAVATTGEQISSVERMLRDHDKDESTLDTKIEKRRVDLERSEKRLATLQAVRPQYMDEYERLQVELQSLYSSYLERFRNLSYLESELMTMQKTEDDRIAESEKRMQRMQKKLRDEELKVLRGEMASNDDDDDFSDSDLAISEGDLDETMGRPKRGAGGRDDGRRPSGMKVEQGGGFGGGMMQKGMMGSLTGGDDSSGDDVDDDDGASDDTHVSMNDDDDDDDDEDLLDDDDDDDDDDDGVDLDDDDDDDDKSLSDNEF